MIVAPATCRACNWVEVPRVSILTKVSLVGIACLLSLCPLDSSVREFTAKVAFGSLILLIHHISLRWRNDG